ncbi:MAG: energy-coupling factor transporter transmembrane component T [Candidatus Neomarinimicrobiota bacterium]
MKINCLVRLWFYLALAISILLVTAIEIWAFFFLIWIFLVLWSRNSLSRTMYSLRPYLIFLPVMVILYVGFSLLMTSEGLGTILYQGGFAFIKLLLMIAVMSLYFATAESGQILDALRSIWIGTGLKWRRIDDFFIYLELTLRFFPTFQRDWEQLLESRQALGLAPTGRRWDAVRQSAADLPNLLFQSLRRADETALSIQMRGYGTVTPRGLANPVPFRLRDGVLFLAVTGLFVWGNFGAAL